MKIAIFPGSFNPPHYGHLFLALDIYHYFRLDLVYFVPSKLPVNKQYLQHSKVHRYNMVKLAIKKVPFFNISDFEINEKGVSYTYKTVKYFKERFLLNKNSLYLIIGEDWIGKFFQWKNYKYILENCNLICVSRKNNKEYIYNFEKKFNPENELMNSKIIGKKLFDNDTFYNYYYFNTNYDISSTVIRNLIKQRKYYRIYLPDSVYFYIVNNGLYI